MHLKKILLTLLVAAISPAASAMSLGEGQMQSYIGEPFVANIALVGGYDKGIRFHQVKSAECRTSVIGSNAAGCDSLYEGPLDFSIKRRPDGQYVLRLTGKKSDDLFYRIVIAYTSPGNGPVYSAFEFLPELKASPDVQPAAIDETDAGVVKPGGKYGVVSGQIIEAGAEDASRAPARRAAAEPSDAAEHAAKRSEKREEVKPAMKSESRLHIKKYGEYADDIHALQKENGEIEDQIALLEKHIGLLKEVIRLKTQIGSQVPEVGVIAQSAPTPARPVRVPVVAAPAQPVPGSDMLTWILLGVVLVLSALLGVMFMKIRRLGLNGNDVKQAAFSPPTLNEIKPLDLTGPFVKPKW